ncbi:MAG TPA: glycosyl hydrolase [Symbiobacteriaceae bacterium]|nr:glycosyl hydrolase [Symbiobacteriaceae bacterium]
MTERSGAEPRRPYPTFAGWSLTREGFADPPADFRPSVYWFWGREVDRSQLLPRMQEMKAAGIPCFWIQTRLGYPMEDYLSPRFFDDYRYCLEEARKLGLKAGLYDEYNWITGHCAGKTVAGHDHFRERHLFWTEGAAAESGTVLKVSQIRALLAEGLRDAWEWMYEGGRPVWGEWQPVRAFAFRSRPDGTIDPVSLVDLTAQTCLTGHDGDSCTVAVDWQPPDAAYRVLAFVSARCTTSRLIDYLNPDAIRRFIEVGYEPFWRELAPYFGDPLYAVFLDEPYAGFYNWAERSGEIYTSFMYNEEFFAQFQADHGFDFRKHLYVLIHKAGDAETARLRCQFYSAYSQRAMGSFFAQLSAWCKEHGIPLTGHELCTSWNSQWALTSPRSHFDSLSQFGADHFGIGELKEISCTDSGMYHHTISAKMGSSIAHVLGKNGSMLEQFSNFIQPGVSAAAGNWNLTLQTLRQKADAYMLQGLSKFIFHGFYQSNDVVDGGKAVCSQRFDFPPGLNFEPWFRYYKAFADHNGRLSYFLSQGTHVARVAVLYPLRTYWAEATNDIFVAETGFLNEQLARLHYDYDIIDERQIRAGEVCDGQLHVQNEGYACIILPAVSTVQDVATMEALRRFVAGGGVLIATGRVPTKSGARGADPAVAVVSRELFAEAGGGVLLPLPLHQLADGPAQLQETLERLVPRAVAIRTGGHEDTNIFYCQRADAEAHYVALFNEEASDKVVALTVSGAHGIPELWDPETGAVTEWRYCTPGEGGMTVHLPLRPWHTTCVRVPVLPGAGPTFAAEALPVRTAAMALELEPVWQFSFDGAQAPVAVRSGQGWERQGFGTFTGLGIYRQTVSIPPEYLGHHLVLEAGDVCHTLEVELNGVPCGVRPWAPFRVDLPLGAVKAGPNELVLKVTNTAGNEFYAGTQYERALAPSGLCGPVRIVAYTVV